jgi:hypothetical protein
MRALKVLLAVVVLFVAFPAAAQVRVTFYAHPWSAGGDGQYPHAFIRITGQPAWEMAPVDETYGFTTKQQALVFFKARGFVEGARPDYVARSTPYFWVEISDDDYRALRERIDTWNRPPGSDYNLYHRNCIVFVADLAQQLGLRVGDTKTLDPDIFMADLKRLNATRVAEGLAPAMEPSGPAVASLASASAP